MSRRRSCRTTTCDGLRGSADGRAAGLYGSDNPTIRQKVDMALKQGGGASRPRSSPSTISVSISPRSIRSISLASAPRPDAPTLVAGLDERSRRIMDDAERRGDAGRRDVSAPPARGACAPRISIRRMPPTRVSRRSRATSPADLAHDDASASRTSTSTSMPRTRRRRGNGSAASISTSARPPCRTRRSPRRRRIAAEDLALPDLEPVTMSEVGTKLDLARAYMDMGDPEGARNILRRCCRKARSTQKQEAQRLLDSLPG